METFCVTKVSYVFFLPLINLNTGIDVLVLNDPSALVFEFCLSFVVSANAPFFRFFSYRIPENNITLYSNALALPL
jgi:hydrogenase-4 membrane subunit HyfE